MFFYVTHVTLTEMLGVDDLFVECLHHLSMQGYNSMYIAVTAIYNSDGLRGFYRGLWAGLLHAIPQASLHFGCYETYKQILSPLVPDTYLGKYDLLYSILPNFIPVFCVTLAPWIHQYSLGVVPLSIICNKGEHLRIISTVFNYKA